MMESLRRPSCEATELDPAGPRAEYGERLAVRRAQAAQQARRHRWIADARLAVFLAGVALAGLAFGTDQVSAIWLVVPILLFVALVIWHGRVSESRLRAERAAAFYERGLA